MGIISADSSPYHDCLSDYNGKGLSVYHDFMSKRYAQYEFVPLNVPFVPCTMMIFLSSIVLHIFQVQQLSGDEVKDEAAPHRFSAVIEKIERLYMVALIY